MTRMELKMKAKEQIKGNIGKLFVVSLIVFAVTMLTSLIGVFVPPISLVANIIVTPGLTIGVVMIYLKICDGSTFSPGEVLNGFNRFWGAFKVNFLVGFFTMLWSLLFVIPGIIKSYSYSMAMYIMAEENCGALDAINKSKKIMEGHKMELFVLQLSFIGWYLLGVVTFGIAYIYVTPYVNAATINFYNSIKNPPTGMYAHEIGIETKPFENN